jgi:hypothetical protein
MAMENNSGIFVDLVINLRLDRQYSVELLESLNNLS